MGGKDERSAVGFPISVLLVEDDPGDVALTRKSMKASKLSNDLHVPGRPCVHGR